MAGTTSACGGARETVGSRRAAVAGRPWHRFADHTSEVCLQVGASSLGELLAEAGRALGALLLRGEVGMAGARRQIEVQACDREALLVDWLNEILYVAETERWVLVDVEVVEASDVHLRARARGVTVPEAPTRVKAATFHGLAVREVAGGLEGEVILDV